MFTSQVSPAELAERSILGAILLDQHVYYQAEAELQPEHFSLNANRLIFKAMGALSSEGRSIDDVALLDRLQRDGNLEKVGGACYLAELIDGAVERRDLKGLAEIIRDQAKRKQLQAACETVSHRTEDPTQNLEDSLTTLEDTVLRLRMGKATKATSIRESVLDVLNEMVAIRRMPSATIGLSTGVLSLDRATTGIRPDEYWVVGALPSRGKTVLGIQMAATNAKQGIATLFFSHEMTRRQLIRRMLPAESGVSAERIRDPRYASEQEMRIVEETAAEMASWPLWIADPDKLTARQLVAIARLHIRQHGIRLIVVDYLQLVEGEGKELRERVTQASDALRAIPKNEGVPVVALSQLARPRDRNENARPSLIDFKETGAIESHAHVALLLYRPKSDEGEWTCEDEVIIAKQREGLVGYEPVVLDSKSLQFVERHNRPGVRG